MLIYREPIITETRPTHDESDKICSVNPNCDPVKTPNPNLKIIDVTPDNAKPGSELKYVNMYFPNLSRGEDIEKYISEKWNDRYCGFFNLDHDKFNKQGIRLSPTVSYSGKLKYVYLFLLEALNARLPTNHLLTSLKLVSDPETHNDFSTHIDNMEITVRNFFNRYCIVSNKSQ